MLENLMLDREGDRVNHLWDIQETNSQLAYCTHTQMISRVCLGSEPGLLRSNKPWGFLNTKVMRHHIKRGLPSSLIYIYIYIYEQNKWDILIGILGTVRGAFQSLMS